MKKIVTVNRDADNRTRIYEVPEEIEVKAGESVKIEWRDTESTGTATQDAIEVEDNLVAYFTPKPLRKVTEKLADAAQDDEF